jgi:Dolichyl-phosphate-mannose-protein mannosyltransferase
MNNLLAFSSRSILPRNEQKLLACIVMLGLLIRIIMVFVLHLPHMHKDSYEYYRQAAIMQQGSYLNYFPNGYPFVILIAKTLSANHSQAILLWLNVVMSSVTIWWVWDIGKRLFHDTGVALTAAFIMAIFPSLINYVRWIMTETPTTFFLVGAYFFYYRKQFWLCGLMFGLAAVIRANIAPVFVLLFLLELIALKKVNYRLLVGALVPILIVSCYCYDQTGKFAIAGNARVNILYAVTASGSHIDFSMTDEYPEIDTKAKAERMYFDHMKKEPGEFMRQRLANAWELWGFYASDSDGHRSPLASIMLGVCNVFLLGAGLFGWWINRKNFMISILILPFLVVTVICVMLITIPRYGYPAEPFLMLTGSWTLVWLMRRKRFIFQL